jgi:hypothetical protein
MDNEILKLVLYKSVSYMSSMSAVPLGKMSMVHILPPSYFTPPKRRGLQFVQYNYIIMITPFLQTSMVKSHASIAPKQDN